MFIILDRGRYSELHKSRLCFTRSLSPSH